MKNNKKGLLIAICAVVAAIAIFAVVYFTNKPQVQEGTKAYVVEVVDDQGDKKTYTGKTDAEYLSGLMDELQAEGDFSYAGTVGDYGLYIETINGITPDYAKDGAYWSIYVNGEYGMFGADSQPVADGETYSFVYEVYVAE